MLRHDDWARLPMIARAAVCWIPSGWTGTGDPIPRGVSPGNRR